MKPARTVLVGLAAACAMVTAASARDLVYTPINPSFGGNPLNTTHLFAEANAQKASTAPEPTTTSTTGGGLGTTNTAQQNFDLFVSQLQGRLLSALATQVTDAIFGEKQQTSGSITFGDQQISFSRTLTSIDLTLTDTSTGQVTNISVPQLVMN